MIKQICPFCMAYMLEEAPWLKCHTCGYREDMNLNDEERRKLREQIKEAEAQSDKDHRRSNH